MRFLKRIVSKAFEKSAKIIIVTSPRLIAFVMSSRMACMTVVVDWPFQNAEMVQLSNLLSSMNLESWRKIRRSYTFDTGKIDMGRRSFSEVICLTFGIAQMRAIFHADGKLRFAIQVLMISVNGEPKYSATILIIFCWNVIWSCGTVSS